MFFYNTYHGDRFGPVVKPENSPLHIGTRVGSNHIAELTGLYEASEYFRKYAGLDDILVLGYDSEYPVFSSKGLYDKVENREIIQKLNFMIHMISCTHTIHFVHVQGRSKNEWNELADWFAQRGAQGEIQNSKLDSISLGTECETQVKIGKAAAVTDAKLVRDQWGKPWPLAEKCKETSAPTEARADAMVVLPTRPPIRDFGPQVHVRTSGKYKNKLRLPPQQSNASSSPPRGDPEPAETPPLPLMVPRRLACFDDPDSSELEDDEDYLDGFALDPEDRIGSFLD